MFATRFKCHLYPVSSMFVIASHFSVYLQCFVASSEVECEGNGSVQPKNLKRKLKRSPSRSPLRTSTPLSTASSRGGRGRGRGRGGRSRTGTILSENLQISVHPGEFSFSTLKL